MLADDVPRLLFRSRKEDPLTLFGKPGGRVSGCIEVGLRLGQVDDVDPVTLHQDEVSHLRIPPTGQVTKVGTRFEQIFDARALGDRVFFISHDVWVVPLPPS